MALKKILITKILKPESQHVSTEHIKMSNNSFDFLDCPVWKKRLSKSSNSSERGIEDMISL